MDRDAPSSDPLLGQASHEPTATEPSPITPSSEAAPSPDRAAPTSGAATGADGVDADEAGADQTVAEPSAASQTRSAGSRVTEILNRLAASEANAGLRAPNKRGFSARAGGRPAADQPEAPATPPPSVEDPRAPTAPVAPVAPPAPEETALSPRAAAPTTAAPAPRPPETREGDDAALRLDIVMPPVPPEQSDFAGPLWKTGAWPKTSAALGALLCLLAAGGLYWMADPSPGTEPRIVSFDDVAALDRPLGPPLDASAFEIAAESGGGERPAPEDPFGLDLQTQDAAEAAPDRTTAALETASLPGAGPRGPDAAAPYLVASELEALLNERPVKCVVPAPLPGADPAHGAAARDLDALRIAGSIAAACVETVTYRPDSALLRRVAPAADGARIEVNAAYSIEDDAICHQTRGLSALVVGGTLPERRARSLESLLEASYAALSGAPICHRLERLGDGPEGPVFRSIAYVRGERSSERSDPRPFVMQRRPETHF